MPLPDPAAAWRVTKSYDHAEGLSCCFRQWQAANSHCRFLHGYALAFAFTFACDTLDERGWCLDFGGLKPLRAWLHEMFDHTTLVGQDDPDLARFHDLAACRLIQLRVVPAIGCEAFAALAYDWAGGFVAAETGGRVRLESVAVAEHAGNAACYRPALGAGDRLALDAGDRLALDAGDRRALDAGDRLALDAGDRLAG